MADGFAQLRRHIERVRSLDGFVERVAPAVAEACRVELERTIKAGTTPDGEAWKPRKDTGEKPLENAAQAVAVVAVGSTVFMRVKGPEARHHKGRGRGGVVREVIPADHIPPRMVDAISHVLTEQFNAAMGGR